MAFMRPEYSNETFAYVTKPDGESYICPQGFEDLKDGDTLETIEGKWFCRLSAPGYLDCTDWDGPFDTLAEARQALADQWNCDPDTGDDLPEDDE